MVDMLSIRIIERDTGIVSTDTRLAGWTLASLAKFHADTGYDIEITKYCPAVPRSRPILEIVS